MGRQVPLDFLDKNYPLSFGSRMEAEEFGKMIAGFYEIAAELMPNNKNDILGD